jgi:site-specific DNA-methyltransferase (cytosine-N4-specific)
MKVRYINANAADGLKGIPCDTIDCAVTFPPYWGLRDYGTGSWDGRDLDCDRRSSSMREDRALQAGTPATNGTQLPPQRRSRRGKCGAVRRDEQIGLEPTFKQHIEVLTAVFREVWRVLKPEGTLWLNYGNSYATASNGNTRLTHDGRHKSGRDDRTHTGKPFSTIGAGLKRKDLSLISARLRGLRGACGSARHLQGRALREHGGRVAGDGAAARVGVRTIEAVGA